MLTFSWEKVDLKMKKKNKTILGIDKENKIGAGMNLGGGGCES